MVGALHRFSNGNLMISLQDSTPLSHLRKSRFREIEFPKVMSLVECCAVTQALALFAAAYCLHQRELWN